MQPVRVLLLGWLGRFLRKLLSHLVPGEVDVVVGNTRTHLARAIFVRLLQFRWAPILCKEWRKELAALIILTNMLVESWLTPRSELRLTLENKGAAPEEVARALDILARKGATVEAGTLERLVASDLCTMVASEMLVRQYGEKTVGFLQAQWYAGRLQRPGGLELLNSVCTEGAKRIAREVLRGPFAEELGLDAASVLLSRAEPGDEALVRQVLHAFPEPERKRIAEWLTAQHTDGACFKGHSSR